jgi:hypothetical protein
VVIAVDFGTARSGYAWAFVDKPDVITTGVRAPVPVATKPVSSPQIFR